MVGWLVSWWLTYDEILKLISSLVHCAGQSVVDSFVMLLVSEMAAMVGLSTHHVHVLSLLHQLNAKS